MSRLVTWAPPIVWTTVVLAMSSAAFSADSTRSVLHPLLGWLLPWLTAEHVVLLHGLARKAAHFAEYAILAGLWLRAFTRSGMPVARSAWLALGAGVACAVVDETHQAFLPSRTGSAADVLLDTLGALAVAVPAGLGWRRAMDATTGALLWVAALGGAVMLAVGLAAGAGGGVLWATVPLAAGLLLYRRRRLAARA